MLLDGILERNREFVRRREPRELPPVETKPLAVVACYDPRLDPLLLPALGIEHGEAFLLRTAGALVLPGGGVMRSLGLAVFMFGCKEILVVGHSSCRMARFENSEFIDMFRARGVAREAFGTDDLREWAGAIPSPARGVLASVETISKAPFLPHDVVVSGAVLDDTTGQLELVVRSGRLISAPEPLAAVEPPAAPAGSGPPAEPATADAPPAARPPAADELTPLVAAIADVVTRVEGQAKWRDEVQILRRDLARTSSPLTQFRLLETFLRRVSGESHEVVRSLDRLRQALGGPERHAVPDPLARLLRRLAGGHT